MTPSRRSGVGTVVLIARDGEVVYRRAAGLADREANLPMKEDAIFRLASVTKPMVTIAAMRLIEQGRIGLDAPVTKWLPDFRPRLEDGREPVILIRHLLTHTSGLSWRRTAAQAGDDQGDDDQPGRRASGADAAGLRFRLRLVDRARSGGNRTPRLARHAIQWGGVYGHHWFIDPARTITAVGLTNTTLEGMWGQFTLDIKNAVAASF